MMMPNKYFYAWITEKFGEYETEDRFVVVVEGDLWWADVTAQILEEFRDGASPCENGAFTFDGYLYSWGGDREITAEEFATMSKYLPTYRKGVADA